MNVLLLIAGLSLSIAGIFFLKSACKKESGRDYIISGSLLLALYLLYFLLDVTPAIIMQIIIIISMGAVIVIPQRMRDYKMQYKDLTGRQHKILKWAILSPLFIVISFVCYPPAFPSILLDKGVIRMGGFYGGYFKISEIQSVDTIQLYPKPKFKSRGSGGWGLIIGNYKLQDEMKLAKFHIKPNCPPYISIRMNDNRLFLLNFKKSDETAAFYNQLRKELNFNL